MQVMGLRWEGGGEGGFSVLYIVLKFNDKRDQLVAVQCDLINYCTIAQKCWHSTPSLRIFPNGVFEFEIVPELF